jgi:hypothetical protein
VQKLFVVHIFLNRRRTEFCTLTEDLKISRKIVTQNKKNKTKQKQKLGGDIWLACAGEQKLAECRCVSEARSNFSHGLLGQLPNRYLDPAISKGNGKDNKGGRHAEYYDVWQWGCHGVLSFPLPCCLPIPACIT